MKPLKPCLALSAVLVFASPLASQTPNNSRFYADVAGHALFPHAARVAAGADLPTPGLDTGAGLTAAFGTRVGQGFSTELEWGYQRAGIGDPDEDLLSTVDPIGTIDFVGIPSQSPLPLPSIAFSIDGDIQVQSLMVNLCYRHPRWRISPYAGFGAGGLFYDTTARASGRINTRFEIDAEEPLDDLPPIESGLEIRSEQRRFGFQLMAGLSFRLRQRVELRLGYRYRSGRSGPVNADQVEGGVRFRF